MPVSPYIRRLRAHIGTDLILLPGVSTVVRDHTGHILLARRSDNGRWSLPAGTVDPGEQPADAALRELYEETGVHARIERLGGVATHPVTYPNGDRCEYLNVWFRCRATGGTARVNDDESTAVAWFHPEQLPDLDDWATLRINTTADPHAPAWHADPGSHHHALTNPGAL
ncbi:NUDIX hydrolase [Mangrovihabitans endophyticus]|uniref:NUDIX hydrolase n=1 Tax=Mangrovihabitans endophyticus TaxID=1751298 RepID=A0A8J3FRT6_9ACTN|nr:NUDIX domain-containing protein [Mangrovihabitans endophyticus]GGL09579.1 NUDIX hydrolase [Mangrovihabitans endophyticus]